MGDDFDYLICGSCDSPCYTFELDPKGRILNAYCSVCANDDPKDFRVPTGEDEEDEG